MKTSAIIPYYRHSASIERAVQSAWQQTVRPDEIIVVNDGSDPEDARSLNRLTESYPPGRLRMIHLNSNQGPGKARNIGWSAARGELLAFLDADDIWHPQKVEVQLEWFRRYPAADLVCGEFASIQSTSQIERDITHCRLYPLRRRDLLVHNPVSTRTVMLRKSIDLRFAEHKRNSEDYQLYLTAVLKGLSLYFCSARLAYSFKSEFGEQGLSARLKSAHAGHVDTLRQVRKQELISSRLYLALRCFAQLKHYRRHLSVRLGINTRGETLGMSLRRRIPFFRFK